jgi:hypothetical protein
MTAYHFAEFMKLLELSSPEIVTSPYVSRSRSQMVYKVIKRWQHHVIKTLQFTTTLHVMNHFELKYPRA